MNPRTFLQHNAKLKVAFESEYGNFQWTTFSKQWEVRYARNHNKSQLSISPGSHFSRSFPSCSSSSSRVKGNPADVKMRNWDANSQERIKSELIALSWKFVIIISPGRLFQNRSRYFLNAIFIAFPPEKRENSKFARIEFLIFCEHFQSWKSFQSEIYIFHFPIRWIWTARVSN